MKHVLLPKTLVGNVSVVPHRSPFRYPGGKTWFVPTLRRWLTSLPRRPEIFIEPFAGGGIIGLTVAFENLAEKVILSELDDGVAAVWETILRGNASLLAERILSFKMARRRVLEVLDSSPSQKLDVAFQTILRNRVSHGGILAPKAGILRQGEDGRGLSSRWYPKTLARRIMDIHEIRHRITFQHKSAFAVIPRYSDFRDCVFFLDPPYTAGSKKAGARLYKHHQIDHEKLFIMTKEVAGDCLLTYDDTPEVRTFARNQGLQICVMPMKTRHHRRLNELIICKSTAWLKRATEKKAPRAPLTPFAPAESLIETVAT